MEDLNFDNYFNLFNLDTRFNIDLKALQRAYINLQQRFHPDKFITQPAKERMVAMHNSIIINEAYDTLRSEIKRAEYLLTLLGGQLQSHSHNQEILLEEIERRELLETNLNIEEIDNLMQDTLQEKLSLLEAFDKYSANLALNEAYKVLTKLKFNIKFCEEIKQKKSKLL